MIFIRRSNTRGKRAARETGARAQNLLAFIPVKMIMPISASGQFLTSGAVETELARCDLYVFHTRYYTLVRLWSVGFVRSANSASLRLRRDNFGNQLLNACRACMSCATSFASATPCGLQICRRYVALLSSSAALLSFVAILKTPVGHLPVRSQQLIV